MTTGQGYKYLIQTKYKLLTKWYFMLNYNELKPVVHDKIAIKQPPLFSVTSKGWHICCLRYVVWTNVNFLVFYIRIAYFQYSPAYALWTENF